MIGLVKKSIRQVIDSGNPNKGLWTVKDLGQVPMGETTCGPARQ